jgi:hypothetical protein
MVWGSLAGDWIVSRDLQIALENVVVNRNTMNVRFVVAMVALVLVVWIRMRVITIQVRLISQTEFVSWTMKIWTVIKIARK